MICFFPSLHGRILSYKNALTDTLYETFPITREGERYMAMIKEEQSSHVLWRYVSIPKALESENTDLSSETWQLWSKPHKLAISC